MKKETHHPKTPEGKAISDPAYPMASGKRSIRKTVRNTKRK